MINGWVKNMNRKKSCPIEKKKRTNITKQARVQPPRAISQSTMSSAVVSEIPGRQFHHGTICSCYMHTHLHRFFFAFCRYIYIFIYVFIYLYLYYSYMCNTGAPKNARSKNDSQPIFPHRCARSHISALCSPWQLQVS